MVGKNPWHRRFDALCEAMSDHWSDGFISQHEHYRDETLYDPVFLADIRGRGVVVDVSENATPTEPDHLDTGGAAEFLRVAIHDPFLVMLDLTPAEAARARVDTSELAIGGRYRARTFDARADALLESPGFRDLVERMEPFAVLRIAPQGLFCGRRLHRDADLEPAPVVRLVEAAVDLAVFVSSFRLDPSVRA